MTHFDQELPMARVFVGNLPEDVRERDLSDKFERFGRIASVKIKFPQRPPPFAFIAYDDEQDASDAVRSMHNAMFSGSRLRVEISRGVDDARPRGTQFRVKLTGLPIGMSWQDLKDFLRDGGDVVHSDVDRRGNGSASFATQEEMRRAIRKLDGTDLDGDRVRIREDVGGRSRSPSRSRSRSPPRRSRSRSPPRRRRSPSRSRSRSRSPRRYSNNRGKRRSRSRSRSR